MLFDSDRDAQLPADVTLTALRVHFDASPVLDRSLELQIFLGDLTVPRARIRLADLVRLGGERPLNLRRSGKERVVIVVVDPSGVWCGTAPGLQVRVNW